MPSSQKACPESRRARIALASAGGSFFFRARAAWSWRRRAVSAGSSSRFFFAMARMVASARMAGSHRSERVSALIRDELNALLQRGLKDPRARGATVSDVKVSKDLKSAKVWVQYLGTPKERDSAVEGLTNATGFIRKELRERLSLRFVPELTFLPDEAGERADRVLGLLAQINREREKPAVAARSEERRVGKECR